MLKLMRQYLKGKALACALLSPMFMFLEVLMDLSQPTMMSNIIDYGVGRGDMTYILQTGGWMILFAFLGVIGGAGCSILSNYAGTYTGGALRKRLFQKIQELSLAEIDRLETSSLITRLTNDVMQIQTMIMTLLRTLTRSPMLCIGGILMSFALSPKLALILCVTLPLLICFAVWIVSRTVPMFTDVQDSIDGMNTVMRENLLGVRVIKTFRLEPHQFARFKKANDRMRDETIKAQGATFLLMPIVTLLMNFSVVAVLWFGGNMEMAGNLQAGKIMAFINYMVQITNAMLMMVNFAVSISRAQASAERVSEVLETAVSVTETACPRLPKNFDIAFHQVGFRYSRGEYAVQDLSFSIREGERVGIIGATGSGKSTLVSLLERFYDATEGSITIGGVDIRDIPISYLRKKVGTVLQEPILFSGTVEDTMRFGRRDAEMEEVENALCDANAMEFIKKMPLYLDSHVEQRGKNFSGGQKQRLTIARTLLQKPEIMILDDSTSALDLATEASLLKAVAEGRKGKTLILIAQRVSSLMNCDTILVLDQGKRAAMGSHSELLKTSEIYRSIAVSQLGEEVLEQ